MITPEHCKSQMNQPCKPIQGSLLFYIGFMTFPLCLICLLQHRVKLLLLFHCHSICPISITTLDNKLAILFLFRFHSGIPILFVPLIKPSNQSKPELFVSHYIMHSAYTL